MFAGFVVNQGMSSTNITESLADNNDKPASTVTSGACKRIGSYIDVCVYENICHSNGSWMFIEEFTGTTAGDGRFPTMLHHGAVHPKVHVPHGAESFLRPNTLMLPVNYFGS
jgi:hypothetical protein